MIKKHIPNLTTSLNLISGSLAAILAFYDLRLACILIFVSIILDFLDGFLARLLNAQSEFGKQLDSFSDLISFGFAPAIIMYLLLLKSTSLPPYLIGSVYSLPFIAVILPLFAAFRLAKFNLQEDTSSFRGLPTPAVAFFIISLPLIHDNEIEYLQWIIAFSSNFYFLAVMVVLLSFLMISNLRMIKLSIDIKDLRSSWLEFIFILLFLAFIFVFEYFAIPFIIILYIIVSLIKPSKT